MKTSDLQRLQKIHTTGTRLIAFLDEENVTAEHISSDYKMQWLVTTPLYNIGEHVYNLSKEMKNAFPEIPWVKIAGLRHRLVHNYDDTNWDVVSEVLFHDLPEFLKEVQTIIDTMKTES